MLAMRLLILRRVLHDEVATMSFVTRRGRRRDRGMSRATIYRP